MSRRIPLSYPLRNLLGRWQAALLSALGIAMTVAVFSAIFALRRGFESVQQTTGREDVIVYTRLGSQSEGESIIPRDRAEMFAKERAEIAKSPQGVPLAAAESFLALYLPLADGQGDVNVPLRGISETSLLIHGDRFRIVKGRLLTFGTNEIMVGVPTSRRMANCEVGDTLQINVTPFEVVGHFEMPGAYGSELWCDADRLNQALDREGHQRVLAQIVPGVDVAAFAAAVESDKRLAGKVTTEREYFVSQSTRLAGMLEVLGLFLTVIFGVAGILGAANTMLASLGQRTHEVGLLRALGFRGGAILLAFLIEAGGIGLLGGIAGALLILPLNGLETRAMNWNTFTDSTFAFRVDGNLLLTAVVLSILLGVLGGMVPSWRAARLRPVEALRRS